MELALIIVLLDDGTIVEFVTAIEDGEIIELVILFGVSTIVELVFLLGVGTIVELVALLGTSTMVLELFKGTALELEIVDEFPTTTEEGLGIMRVVYTT